MAENRKRRTKRSSKAKSKKEEVQEQDQALLVEAAWEVVNQVGGIYTVIRSKIPSIKEQWGGRYIVVGPYVHSMVAAEFEHADNYDDDFGKTVEKMRDRGIEAYYGTWLVSGRPRAILINPNSIFNKLGDIKYIFYEHHGIDSRDVDSLFDRVMAFGWGVQQLLECLLEVTEGRKQVLAHFHEWMGGAAIPEMRRQNVQVKTIFTTHATLLGRYLAMNDHKFYEHLPFYDWESEAKHFNIYPQVALERAAAHGAHVMTTVSDVTGHECTHLLGRTPDVILPNGLNIERFVALHEFQNLHQEYKDKIHQFVIGHFFKSYAFDLDKTLYFFTSGRYEYRNKGFDLTLEALARLNWMLQDQNLDVTVVMFFVTRKPYHNINPDALHSHAVMREIRNTCLAIEKQIGDRLFYSVSVSEDDKLPPLNDFVDDYWRLRLRRTLQSWRTKSLPAVVTHNLVDDANDEILNFLRTSNLLNNAHDRVKVVYHPEFINATNPLFAMEYDQFVRGCNLGIFPSYYEPWGYTPLECIARGVPAVTSNLSGFGDYVLKIMKESQEKGIYVVDRKDQSYHQSAHQLAEMLLSFVKMTRRERIDQRNRVESASEKFDWQNLSVFYNLAYNLALER